MDYCGPGFIPHSVFLGRVLVQSEPYWLDTDRAKALAWQSYVADEAAEDQAARCPHGHRRADWFDDDGKEIYPFVVEALQCPACEVLEEWRDERKKLESQQDGAGDKGIFPVFRPNVGDEDGE